MGVRKNMGCSGCGRYNTWEKLKAQGREATTAAHSTAGRWCRRGKCSGRGKEDRGRPVGGTEAMGKLASGAGLHMRPKEKSQAEWNERVEECAENGNRR
jgi:hypothetical protein